MKKIPDDEIELRKLAVLLGVSTHKTVDPVTGKTDIPELQSRIINAQRSIMENRLWWVAVIAATSSLLSAAATWFAVLKQ